MKIWDAQSGECLLTLSVHEGPVRSVEWRADGQKILSGSDDGTFKVWDAETGKCLWTGFNLPEAEVAAYRECDRAIAGTPRAWRFLGWQWKDPQTNQLRVLPAEHFSVMGEAFPQKELELQTA